MLAGGREAAGPVHVDGRHPELVPPAGPNVHQLHPLIGGLRGRGTEKPFIPTYRSALCLPHTLSRQPTPGGLDHPHAPSWRGVSSCQGSRSF